MNLRNLAGFAVGPIGAAALGFLIVPLTAWYFPAEDVGRIAMLQVGISFCLLFFSLGLDQAYVREYHETQDKPALLQACMLPGLVLLLGGLLLFSLDPARLARLVFGTGDSVDGLLLGLCLLMAYLSRFLALVLRMEERGLTYSLSQLLPKVSFLAVLGLFIVTATGHDFRQLLLAHTAAFSSVTLWLLWSTRAIWLRSVGGSRQVPWKKLMHFGLPLVFSGMAFWGMTSLDRVFLRHFSTFDQLGIYSVACSFAGVAIVLQSIFSTVWAPLIYKKSVEGVKPEEINSVTRKILALVIFILALSGTFSWVLGFLLPPKYSIVQRIFCACLVYPLFYTLSEASGIGLGLSRRSSLSMISTLAALIAGLFLSYVLTPIYGAAGAASSVAISFFFMLVLKTEFSARFWHRSDRFAIYTLAAIGTGLAVCNALITGQSVAFFNAIWFALLIACGIFFRDILSPAMSKISK